MARIAFVTDSASDLDAAVATARGIRIVPLEVTFGDEKFRAGVDLSTAAFWERMTAPDAPFPKTAAASPGDFKAIYDGIFAEGAEAIISVHVSGSLSGAIKSAEIARGMLADREIHVVDSQGASMAEAILCFLGQELAASGAAPVEIAATLTTRANDLRMAVSLETLEYLKRGGRISAARAALGTLLSVKPIIEVEHGQVDVAEKPRTRSKSRERCIEILCERPIEQISILHTMAPDVDAFRDEVIRRGNLNPDDVMVSIVGPSVGPHLGPGCVGAAVLYRSA
ncbi:MAG TPA: DegV family protein [Candidatus Limnocylindrales bacterium]|nr:DegV family protein [Candidatus Limnocylindrales bacterium]